MVTVLPVAPFKSIRNSDVGIGFGQHPLPHTVMRADKEKMHVSFWKMQEGRIL